MPEQSISMTSARIRQALVSILVWVTASVSACSTTTEPSLPNPSDPAQVTAELTSKDGTDFLLSVGTYAWSDDGARAAEVFRWIPAGAAATDRKIAERAGESAHAIAAFLADKEDRLLDIRSGLLSRNHTTVGGLNPDLVRSFGEALIPYQGALVCDDRNARGFDPLESCGGSMPAVQSVFSVISTDADAAAAFSGAAHVLVDRYVQTFADTELSSPAIYPAAQGLTYAGSLLGLLSVTVSKHEKMAPVQIDKEATHVRYTVAKAALARELSHSLPEKFFIDGALMTPEQVQLNLGDAGYSQYSAGLVSFLSQRNVETFIRHNIIGQFQRVSGQN
ncbi:hypothetical protein [Mycolicibacterium conceptionense]|uniref:hypothetical protein n=1 Tax=Mycolicibacterium conceptionense TaxID=451644 RepID=UPI001F38ED40|nr:hypothetical protein [Mycolicibacterium conceptionense]